MRRFFAIGVLATVIAAIAVSVAGPAGSAQFPGANGRIGYTRISQQATYSIRMVNPDGSGDVEVVSSGRDASWNSGATKMVFVTTEANSNTVKVANGDGTGASVIYTAPSGYNVWYPTMSADGTKVAFMQRDSGFTTFDLYVINADGTGATNLTFGGYQYINSLQFSPDGTKILFAGSAQSSPQSLQVATISTATVALVSSGKQLGAWAPDGLSVFAVQNVSGASTIYRMNPDGTGQTTLFTGASVGLGTFGIFMPSPDGTKLVFSNYLSGPQVTEIWTVNLDGTGAVAVATTDTSITPNWTSGGAIPSTTTTTASQSSDPVAPAFTG